MPMSIPQKVVKRLSNNQFVVESKKGKKYVVDCLRECNPNLIIENEFYFIEFHYSYEHHSKRGYLTGLIVEGLL